MKGSRKSVPKIVEEKRVPKEVEEKIRKAKERNFKELDLRSSGLTEFPESITELVNLTTLDLSGNKLTEIPESITRLGNLTTLELRNNKLAKMPESITRLEKLTMLNLNENNLTEIPESIASLINLTELFLGNNNLTKMPESITRLGNLTALNLSHNDLTEIPESITRLEKLTKLGLGGNNFTRIPENITGLAKLTDLYLWGNQLTEILENITRLQKLKIIQLNDNELTEIPENITKLENLTAIVLSGNRFMKIPDCIYELKLLKTLDFANYHITKNKNQIKEISPKILQLENLQELKLDRNPVEIPPPEVVKKGVQAIKDYFRQMQEGEDRLYEAKLLIVGEPSAGKTSLAKKIKDKNYILKRRQGSTKGIDVITWNFRMEDGQDFRANIWDFGGQQIYHATHQFFLTKRSFYVLVCDMRKEDTDFYYWLSIVELLSDNSPLIIVKNEIQNRKREIGDRQLRGEFTNFRDIFATDLATNRGLDEIVSAVKFYMTNLSIVGTPLPKTWVRVREILEKNKRNYISLDEYMKICEKNGFKEDKDKLQLSGYLHDIGVCLHFQDDMILKRTVILKPEWGTDAVYKVLDNEKVINNLGRFDDNDLASIWNERKYADMHAELLRLMLNFKLCYRIPGKDDTYIAPQLLTENQPIYDWDENENLILQYQCEEFMPKGMLCRFIVEMHRCITDENLVWKSGVILERDRTKAEVIENYGRREIKIRVVGMHKKEFVTLITDALDMIHNSFNRLKYKKQIPCNCSKCKNIQDPHFYEYKVLRRYMDDRRDQIECNESYERVDVRKLIDDVFEEKKDVDIKSCSEEDMEKFDVFLSYNSEDEDAIEAIANELENRGLKPWYAKKHLPPGRLFQEELEKILPIVASVAVFVGSSGIGPWENMEMRAAISQFIERKSPVIPSLLPDAKRTLKLPLFLSEFSWVKFNGLDDSKALDNLEFGITGKRTSGKP